MKLDWSPADANESADALALLDQEQSAHENTIEQISIDGAGFDGPAIRQLESRGITAFVPPKEPFNGGQRNEGHHKTNFRFAKETWKLTTL